MKKFWEKHKAAILAFILALLGAGGMDSLGLIHSAGNDADASETLKQGADVQGTPETITFEVMFYAKQKGTPDNIYVRDIFKADSLPPLDKIMEGVAVPDGYEVNNALPIYLNEIKREKAPVNEPPTKEPEEAPEIKPPKDAETQ